MAHPGRRGMLLNAYENAAVIVSGIEPGELAGPTPCPSYDVAGLIDHLVDGGERVRGVVVVGAAPGARRVGGGDFGDLV